MNYIQHLNATFADIYADDRLHASHISLYLALFFYWNLHRFPKEFYANRKELMHMAKIGSKSTYHRLVKELDKFGYIDYHPAKSPHEISMVALSQNCTDSGTLMGRTRTIFGTYRPKSVPDTLYNKQYKPNKRSLGAKPKSQLEVLDFFKEKKYVLEEAFKFFNHYQAIGWKIGGKVAIQDWKAAADNWVLKAKEIAAQKIEAKKAQLRRVGNSDNLITETEKDYGQPL
ncbi:transcriptional regulator [Croceitalea sp. MTPC9]|uniref:hypothetical protein n=1 Tax=unclassified Croceitalea TaxID=2632280 RepID=UPI002B3C5C24|nr:transcriptional regulator [Croceitalea sp. MTPC6]GMN16125.1 transcriptional regulator [Croceitalea sp. MTPC9]